MPGHRLCVCVCVCVWIVRVSLCTEHFMSQFFIVPYSLLPGHNAKTISHISAEHCAQLCVHDDTIVCRSFDYHVSSTLRLLDLRSMLVLLYHVG